MSLSQDKEKVRQGINLSKIAKSKGGDEEAGNNNLPSGYNVL